MLVNVLLCLLLLAKAVRLAYMTVCWVYRVGLPPVRGDFSAGSAST